MEDVWDGRGPVGGITKTDALDRKGEMERAADEGLFVVVKSCYDFPLHSRLAPSYNISIYISTC